MDMLRRWWAKVRGRGRAGHRDDARLVGDRPPRDYAREREDARAAGMSEDNRAWEAASRERERERQEVCCGPWPASC